MMRRCFPRYPQTVILRLRRLDWGDEQGIGIVFAVFVASLVFILGAGWTQIATHQVGVSGFQRNREQAIDAAEAGVYRALTLLSEDPTTTSVTLSSLDQGTTRFGEYEVTITTDPLDANARLVRSTGYGPRQGSKLEAARTLEANVLLLPDDDFNFTLFASDTSAGGFGDDGIDLGQSADVAGDIFAGGTAEWEQSSTIAGNVSAWDRITSQGTVQGNLTSAGEDGVGGAPGGCPHLGSCNVWVKSGSVTGNIYAADDPSTTGTTEGWVDVCKTGASISPDPDPSVTGTITTELADGVFDLNDSAPCAGTVTPSPSYGVPSVPPPKRLLPTFDWDLHVDDNFGGSASDYSLIGLWDTYFQANHVTGISGAHEITLGQASSDTVRLGGSIQVGATCPAPPLCVTVPIDDWEISGDTTIFTDRPILFDSDVTNADATPHNLVIISTYDQGPAVEFETGVSIPSSVDVLVYAPGEAVTFDVSADELTGSVYAKSIEDAGSFEIDEADLSDVAGFTWPSVDYAPVQVTLLREVPS